MKMLVTGAKGFVGRKIMEYCKDAIACPSLRDASEDEVKRIVEESGADVIVHTAAVSDISTCDRCPDMSWHANVSLPVYLAKASGKRKLICFSSDQVYSGCGNPGPYTETIVNPANLYARQKLEMEQRVLEINGDAVLLRAEWMYDLYEHRDNYFMRILKAENEVYYSRRHFRGLTYVREVAENIEKLVSVPGGVYNFGSETSQSMYDITCAFTEYIGKKIRVIDVEPQHNLWMDTSKARSFGIEFSDVLEGLKKCADDYRDDLGRHMK